VDSPADLETFLGPLAAAGVSLFHVSVRRYWQPAFDGDDRTLAGWTRQLTGLPVITVGSVGVQGAFLASDAERGQASLSLAPLLTLLERGEFDLVALGRASLADPGWAAKLADGRPGQISPYDRAAHAVLH
jgi:2,4-dienoyl-CoA reductase-like NADH-dependent reductase (Old Yellow Enzyme family)